MVNVRGLVEARGISADCFSYSRRNIYVDSHVFLLGRHMTETFVTVLTFKRFLSCVSPPMPIQVTWHAKRLVAPTKGTLERFEAGVNPIIVFLQVTFSCETSATNRTLERSLACVGPNVSSQVIRFVERLTASLVTASESLGLRSEVFSWRWGWRGEEHPYMGITVHVWVVVIKLGDRDRHIVFVVNTSIMVLWKRYHR